MFGYVCFFFLGRRWTNRTNAGASGHSSTAETIIHSTGNEGGGWCTEEREETAIYREGTKKGGEERKKGQRAPERA